MSAVHRGPATPPAGTRDRPRASKQVGTDRGPSGRPARPVWDAPHVPAAALRTRHGGHRQETTRGGP